MKILMIILLKINSLIPQWLIWSGSGLGAAIAGFFVTKKRLKKKKKVTLEQVMGEVKTVKERVNNIDERQRNEEFIHSMEYKIKDIVNSVIDSRSLDSEIESLLIDGADKAVDLFTEIKRSGYNNITSQYVKRVALQKIKSLSNNYGTIKFDDKIKQSVAYPAINKLLSDLEAFKREIFNGKTDEKFLDLALSFVNDFVNNAIEVYNKEMREN